MTFLQPGKLLRIRVNSCHCHHPQRRQHLQQQKRMPCMHIVVEQSMDQQQPFITTSTVSTIGSTISSTISSTIITVNIVSRTQQNLHPTEK